MKYTEEERLQFAKSIQSEQGIVSIDPTAEIYPTSVIGQDGFGWVRQEDGTLYKMPHRGGVIIEKNVVVRELCTIDRAVNGNTIISEGTKLDHHIHIAHGAKIGKNNTLASGCCVEGSCEIGDNNTFGAGVVVQTKIKIGNRNTFGSGAIVVKDVGDNEVWAGCPAVAIDVKSKYKPFPLDWEHDEEFAKYLVGFVDGEAYFSKCHNKKGGNISFKFGIELSKKDKELLYQIKDFFGVGVIRDRRRKTIVNKLDSHQYSYTVSSSEDISAVILPFFDNYILRGFKKVQYKRWREDYLDYRQRPGAWSKKNPMQLLIK